ncbi:hypothetical protein [Kiloniella sp. EL199]|uniref:hypothetical protein n=1 Tax=Kiloniella sp. EL199 TaxID=2107581 RepID=UPI000EA325C4|nr:hypothetical protein [Kiloniella sp. EL199]
MKYWFQKKYIFMALFLIAVCGGIVAEHATDSACSDGIEVYSIKDPKTVVFELHDDKKNISLHCNCYFEKKCKTNQQVFYYTFTQDGINFKSQSYQEKNLNQSIKGEVVVRVEITSVPNVHLHASVRKGKYRDFIYGLEYYPLHSVDKWYPKVATGTEYYLARGRPILPWKINDKNILFHCPGGSPQFKCFAKFLVRNDIGVQILFERQFIPQWENIVEQAIKQIVKSNPS